MIKALTSQPVTLIIILGIIAISVARALPAVTGVTPWIATGMLASIGTVMTFRPERSGIPFHPTSVRMAAVFVLGVLVFLLATDLLTTLKGQ